MGDDVPVVPKSTAPSGPSVPQMEETLWSLVTLGNLKDLQQFIETHSKHSRFSHVLNSLNEELDEDGGNVLVHAVRMGRDKGAGKGKDYRGCMELLVKSGVDIDGQDKSKSTALAWAVALRYPNCVATLLKLGASVSIADQDGMTPFQTAIQNGHKELVTIFIEHNIELKDLKDGKGVPPLVTAVRHGQIDICRLLLEKGSDVNACEDKSGKTPVYHAIRKKRIDILELLLKYKPNVDTVDSEGRSILFICCESTDPRYFQKVIQYRQKFPADIMEKAGEDKKTALLMACQRGNAEQVKHLLEQDASVKATDALGKSSLHYCADNLETQCAEMLLEKDASIVDLRDEQGYTALALAVLVGNVNLMKLLLEKGADIDTRDDEGHKLGHWAAGHLKALDVLIQHKADMSTPDNHHAYPIHYAAQMNSSNSGNTDPKISEKVLKKLIDCKVRLDVVDDADRQPLIWAACSGNAESCKLLLKAGADINTLDKDDLTAMHCAASRGHYTCIEVLRKHGADVNLMDKNRCTPLFYAITLGNKDCTKALIAAKADVNHVDDRGRNPVHCAAIKGCLDSVKLLEKEKANLWHPNKKGDYAVHEAAQKGHLDVVKYLLRQKNDKEAVNVTNESGKTLLHIAAATNNLPLCKLLMNYDCDKNALMKHAGKEFTPYDLAVIKNYQETADFLKSKGAAAHADVTNIKRTKDQSPGTTGVKGKSPEKKDDKKETPKKKRSDVKPHPPPQKKTETGVKKGDQSDSAKGDTKTAESKTENSGSVEEKGKTDETESTAVATAKGETSKESPKRTGDQKGKGSPKKEESQKKSDSPKSDKSVGIDKTAAAINTDSPKSSQLKKKTSADSVLEKNSDASLQSEDSDSTKDAQTQKNGVKEVDHSTSPEMGGTSSKGKQEQAKTITVEEADPNNANASPDIHQQRRSGKVGFRGGKSDNEDSGNETDRSRSKRLKHGHGRNNIGSIQKSVRQYQDRRNQSRGIQQLKRAQMHTAPMHDIVMFSRMMDNYRRGLGEQDEDLDLRSSANWDGYLNNQLRYMSSLYRDDSKSPRDVQETAKECHKRLSTEARNRKKDSDTRVGMMKKKQEREKKYNADMDREIDGLARRTAEMFDNVKGTASSRLSSAKVHNSKLKEEMQKCREEKLQTTSNPEEREMLQNQEMDEELTEQQKLWEKERKEKYRQWHRRKDEEMRRRLLSAYRPYFPNDVFNAKSVCISGGRIKSASLRNDPQLSPSPRPRRTPISPRPVSQKSDASRSVSQYKPGDDKTKVQMTPYGLRRIRNQERPSYEDLEGELAETIFFNTPSNRCSKSADASANWSRKYDGSIRPRTGLVFVEPRVYGDLMREERDSKSRLSSRMRSQFGDGPVRDSRTEIDSMLS